MGVLSFRFGGGSVSLVQRLWAVVLAVAVVAVLVPFVQLTAWSVAATAPPPAVPSVPPRVTDPGKVHRLGFPALPGQAPGDVPIFDAVEVYPGIWIANHRRPDGPWTKFGAGWGLSDDAVVWQRNVDQLTADLDRLWSTGPSRTTMRVAGTLPPAPAGSSTSGWITPRARAWCRGR